MEDSGQDKIIMDTPRPTQTLWHTHLPCLLGSLGPRTALVTFEGGHGFGHAVCVQHSLLHIVRDLLQALLLLCLCRHGSCAYGGWECGGDGRECLKVGATGLR